MTPYIPQVLPLVDAVKLDQIITLVGEANSALANYNGILQAVPNPRILLSPLVNREAVLSSKIEGTQATFEEVLEHEAGHQFNESKETDIREIINYRKALIIAQEYLNDGRSLSLSLVLELHQVLMDSVRGADKSPGMFRDDQNYIGFTGSTQDEAIFVPPDPLLLKVGLDNWGKYLACNDIDPLYQSAIVHAQFELLHPFKDGNGRIGRLLIPLFLYSKDRLSSPTFYLSEYLEGNRAEYYERLKRISANEDWTGWVMFFLKAIISQSKLNIGRVKKIMGLYEEMKILVQEITGSQFSNQITDAIFKLPIFRVAQFNGQVDVTKASAHTMINKLVDAKILVETRKRRGSKPAIYSFASLLKIADDIR